jgi:hypothetical protein
MANAPRRLAPLAAAVLLGVWFAACKGQSVPRLRFPQVEQASEAVQGRGERYRDHQTCFKASKSVDDLVRCMKDEHWQFVAHGAVFPEGECWEAREHRELDRVGEQCFVRDPEHR